MEISLNGNTYTVAVIHKRIRNMYLRVQEDGSLLVTCPKAMSDQDIRKFVISREKWIERTARKVRKTKTVNQSGATGPVVYWHGEKKYARYLTGKKDSVSIDGDIMTFCLRDTDPERIEKVFYQAAAKELADQIQLLRKQWDRFICMEHGLPLPEIKVRYMTSRWGVCAVTKNRITMSTRLIHYPSVCTEYVLLHEYAHLLSADHSSRFYSIVRHYMPEYREYEKILKG